MRDVSVGVRGTSRRRPRGSRARSPRSATNIGPALDLDDAADRRRRPSSARRRRAAPRRPTRSRTRGRPSPAACRRSDRRRAPCPASRRGGVDQAAVLRVEGDVGARARPGSAPGRPRPRSSIANVTSPPAPAWTCARPAWEPRNGQHVLAQRRAPARRPARSSGVGPALLRQPGRALAERHRRRCAAVAAAVDLERRPCRPGLKRVISSLKSFSRVDLAAVHLRDHVAAELHQRGLEADLLVAALDARPCRPGRP